MKKLLYSLLGCLLAGTAYSQIGFGTATPHSTLDVRGGVALNTRTFTGATSAGATDEVLLFTGTAAATVTLPDATTCTGRIYWIKNASTTNPVPVLTIATTASQTIEGVATTQLDEPYEVIRLVSNGSMWVLFSENTPVYKSTSGAVAWYQGGNRMSALRSVGTITNFDMGFMTNNAERMRLNTSGFWGLGTTNPEGRLHVVTDNDDNGNNYIMDDYGAGITSGVFIRKSRGTIAAPQDLQNGDLIGQFRLAPYYNGALVRNGGSGMDAYYLGTGSNIVTDLRWFTSNTEQVRINQNGNVGIGTTSFNSTAEKLVVDAGTAGSYNVISGKGDIDNYLQLNIKNGSNGNSASSDIVATADNGTESVNFIDMGINSGSYSTNTSLLLNGINQAYLYSIGNDFIIGNGSAGRDLIFFTNGYALANERMRITAAGLTGIGTSTPTDRLTVAGIVTPSADNTYTMGSSTARWTEVWSANGVIQTSDVRFKTNIQPLDYGVQTIAQMRPVRFNWKGDTAQVAKIGLLAQEVQQLVPEVVTGDAEKNKLGMNYAELVVVLIRTIQQQHARLGQLTRELEALEQPSK